MDNERLDSSLSLNDVDETGGERDNRFVSFFSYTNVFNKKFPLYLAYGMTPEQYWEQDCMLAKYYREADEIKRERRNQEMWLQGMYFYDALMRVSPILRAFGKKGTKPQSYVEEPYAINKKTIKAKNVEREKNQSQKALRYLQAYMVENNKRFDERK